MKMEIRQTVVAFAATGARRRGRAPLALCLAGFAASAAIAQTGGATYTLKPTPKTVAWGYYDASTPPVLRIKSGDIVEIQTLAHERA